MVDFTGMPVYPLTDWNVNNLRFTAFPVMAERRTDLRWWSEAVGTDSETRTTRTTPAQIEESGPFESGGRLSLTVTPVRTDWLLTGIPTPSPSLDSAGIFPEVYPIFVRLVKRWLALESRFPIQRIAFGGFLIHPEATREAGYERLSRYLKDALRVDLRTSQDLLFQINKPILSRIVEGLTINRLTKWLVLSVQFTLLMQAGVAPMSARGMEQGFATALELDLNTGAEHEGPLGNERLDYLLDELVQHAVEMASDGVQG